MRTRLTAKGQVTVPKHVRDQLGLGPGAEVEFGVNADGDVVLRPVKSSREKKGDRFQRARGIADIKWRTDDLMALLRGKD